MTRAPSWSWASVDSNIVYDQSLYLQKMYKPVIHCKLLHAEVHIKSKSVVGIAKIKFSKIRLLDGEVSLNGSLLNPHTRKNLLFSEENTKESLKDRLRELNYLFYPDRDPFPSNGDFYLLRIVTLGIARR